MSAAQSATQRLRPVLVVGSGRSGTTPLMRLLASSPQVATEVAYPLEHQYLRYLRLLTRAIDAESWDGARWDHLRLHVAGADPSSVGGLVGPPPWRERGLTEPAEGEEPLSDRALVAIWDEFSARVRARHAERRGEAIEATYWAEKCPDHPARLGLPAALAPRCVYVVRDLRDQWASMAAMARRRERDGSRRLFGDAGEDALGRFVAAERRRLAQVIDSVEGDRGDAILVRYEDLVADGSGASRRVAGFLGVELDPAALEAFDRDHATSESATRSVGRWRHDLSREARETIEEELGDLLARFGYEPARRRPGMLRRLLGRR